jgi:hypothetical protein
MKLPSQFFFYATCLEIIILAPLFIWNPFLCMSDEEEFATSAYADDVRSSRLLLGSCLCILTASLAPLVEALFDLWRFSSGMASERSPYTWNVDGASSTAYLVERLFVILVYDVLTVTLIVVISPESNYESTVIYNVIRGSGITVYALTGNLFLSILRTSAEVRYVIEVGEKLLKVPFVN